MPRQLESFMPWPSSYWLSFIPGKATLVLLFRAAKRRLFEQSDDMADLPNSRIISATEEMNQIADDVRAAQKAPEESTLALPKADTGKIPREAKNAN